MDAPPNRNRSLVQAKKENRWNSPKRDRPPRIVPGFVVKGRGFKACSGIEV